jgi:hypothetical protein
MLAGWPFHDRRSAGLRTARYLSPTLYTSVFDGVPQLLRYDPLPLPVISGHTLGYEPATARCLAHAIRCRAVLGPFPKWADAQGISTLNALADAGLELRGVSPDGPALGSLDTLTEPFGVGVSVVA